MSTIQGYGQARSDKIASHESSLPQAGSRLLRVVPREERERVRAEEGPIHHRQALPLQARVVVVAVEVGNGGEVADKRDRSRLFGRMRNDLENLVL